MIEAILFDLGETLIHIDNSVKTELEELRIEDMVRFLSKRRISISMREFRRVFEKTSRETFTLVLEQNVEATIREIFAKTFHRLGLQPVEEEFLEGLEKTYYKREVNSWRLFDHAEEALNKFREMGFKLGLVSNTRSDWQVRETIRRLGIGGAFKVVVTSAQLGVRKPRPDPFLKALEIVESKPETTVMVGDTLTTDILGARSLGVKAIYVRRRWESKASIKPDAEVRSLVETYPVIERWLTTKSSHE